MLRRYLPADMRRYLPADMRRYLPADMRRYLPADMRRYLFLERQIKRSQGDAPHVLCGRGL